MALILRSYFLVSSPRAELSCGFFSSQVSCVCVFPPAHSSLFSPTALKPPSPTSLVLLGAPWVPLLIIPESTVRDKPQSLPGEEFLPAECLSLLGRKRSGRSTFADILRTHMLSCFLRAAKQVGIRSLQAGGQSWDPSGSLAEAVG